jgi:hypothetical protein
MAKDRAGFEQGRRRDSQGRPLKLISKPPTEEFRKGWEQTFKKPSFRMSVGRHITKAPRGR